MQNTIPIANIFGRFFLCMLSYPNPEEIKHICDEMGHYHQCQNDLLDVFNVGGILHKTGHDIEINKCSWLSTTCMERANDVQKQIMIDNYGKKGEWQNEWRGNVEWKNHNSTTTDPECIERVRQLYLDMDLHQVYKEFAYKEYDHINGLIDAAPCKQPMKEVLYQINDLLFHRKWPYDIAKST